jgi:predicted Zn-dependent peptidase
MTPKFFRKVLSNGMTVILEKRDLPVVSVTFAVRAGGINEDLSEKGISHFIEHMLYKGTAKRNTKQIAGEIEKRGGELNGFTSEEITAYYCKMPSKHLGVALEVLSDMVKNPLFDETELEKERQVIFEEIKMRKDIPSVYVFDKMQDFLYTGTMEISVTGTVETMSSIGREQMLKKFEETYTPNNLILCVVGDADFDKLVDFAEKTFGNEKGKVPTQKFGLKNEVKTEKRKGIDQANSVFAYHIPLGGDKKSYAAKILGILMAGGMSSRLFEEIREKRNLAYSVKGDSQITENFAYSFIYVGCAKENVEKVKKLILEEYKKVSDSLNEEELNHIKTQLIGNHHISQEDSQSQMVSLLAHEIDGDAKKFYEFEKNISEVKLKDVKALAKKVVKGDYSFFALLPA